MDMREGLAAELGQLVGTALRERGQTQAWLAAQVERSPGSISKLVGGSWIERGGVGPQLVKAVEVVLGFPDDELVGLYDRAAAGGRTTGTTGDTVAAVRLDVRPPREVLFGSLLSDSWLHRLRCYLVAPNDSRDNTMFQEVKSSLHGAAMEVIDSTFPWDVFEGDEEKKLVGFARECERAESCDLAVLLVSQGHAVACDNRRSVLEALAEHFAIANIPCLIYASPGATAHAYNAKQRKGFQRDVVERLYRFEPERLGALTYFRVVEAPSNSALARDLLTTISSLASASLFNLRAQAQVAWNDNHLADLENSAREMWVYTRDFYYELDDARWRQIVLGAIRRGARYRWLFPAAAGEKARLLLARTASLAGEEMAADRLSFYALEDAGVPWWPQVAIYDPDDEHRRRAFMYELWGQDLPLSCAYNYKVPDEQTGRLVGAFAELCTDARRWVPR